MTSSSANFFSLLGDVGFFFFFGLFSLQNCRHHHVPPLPSSSSSARTYHKKCFFFFFLFFFFCFFLMCLLPSFTILLFSFVCSDECEVIINVTEKSNASFISKFKLKKKKKNLSHIVWLARVNIFMYKYGIKNNL